MGKIIVIANQKGGVGKTTTAINLSASLALAERDILVVDIDPQGNLTSGLGIQRDRLTKSLYDVFFGNATINDVITQTLLPHLYIVPSSIDLVEVEISLVNKSGREEILKNALLPIKDRFRYIFIDCPPSLGLLTLNAMTSADSILIPVQCEYYSLEGLGLLSDTIRRVRGAFNPNLDIEGVLLTMFDSRNTLSRQVYDNVKRYFNEKVYKTIIGRNVTLAEAPSHGKPAIVYDIRSKGAQNYLALAKEILNEGSTGKGS
ncbi:MAG: AAA family ATPase [Thermodesulfovibrionales bacterium]|nr:AAA family ATPase [Thermodesulfovibrionales bacterium]